MILNKIGEALDFNGEVYRVGDMVMAKPGNHYAGSMGVISEIRTENDKETENEFPDIYCRFNTPVSPETMPYIRKEFEDTHGFDAIEDITSGPIIMAPNMLSVLSDERKTIIVYSVEEDWATNEESGHSVKLFSDYDEARAELGAMIMREATDGIVSEIYDCFGYVEEFDNDCFSGYIDGEYLINHYDVSITKHIVPVSDSWLSSVKELAEIKI